MNKFLVILFMYSFAEISNFSFLVGILLCWVLILLIGLKIASLYRKLTSDYQDYWFPAEWYKDPILYSILLFGKTSYTEEITSSGKKYKIKDVKILKAGFWTRFEI